jgi:integrase/recombinase XerD
VYVSKYLRHKKLEPTMAYLEVTVADIQNEMEKIDDGVGMFV